MTDRSYYSPPGGLPPQSQILTDRAMFTTAYAVIPRGTFTDIVTSQFPHWEGARFWVIARPLSGFAESFSHYIAEVQPGGGSERPETDAGVQAVLFVTGGSLRLTVGEAGYDLGPGGYAYLPPDQPWSLRAGPGEPARFHWIRKLYQWVDGVSAPEHFVTSDAETPPVAMPETEGRWATSRFADPADLRHDMHVNIVTFQPGGVIPFAETHVMEHGFYVLEGKAVYRLNQDWVEVEAGDYMWLRAFCPQACYAGGPGRFRYLLYKDVNRHMALQR